MRVFMKQRWISILRITAAIAAGVWFPLRVVFFDALVPADFAVEGVVFTIAMVSLFRNTSDTSRSEMWLSVLESVPLFLLFYPALGSSAELLAIPKILLLRHLFRIRDLLDSMDSLHPVLARILPLSAIVPIVMHTVACGWIFLGSGTAGTDPEPWVEYVRALYWTVATLATVGYGDISATTPLQMLYASITMVGGVAFFGYVLSNVAAMLARMDAAKEQHSALLDRVETFMRFNRVPPEMRGQIRDYFRYVWESRRGYDDSFVLSSLPQKLRSDLHLYLNSGLIGKVPIFRDASPEMLHDVLAELKTLIVVPEEIIFHSGEPAESMYFIHRGSVGVYSAQGEQLAILDEGSFFGETALITANVRTATLRAHTYCDLYVLHRSALETVISRYPEFRTHIEKTAQDRLRMRVA